jgi:hypothetical protein
MFQVHLNIETLIVIIFVIYKIDTIARYLSFSIPFVCSPTIFQNILLSKCLNMTHILAIISVLHKLMLKRALLMIYKY